MKNKGYNNLNGASDTNMPYENNLIGEDKTVYGFNNDDDEIKFDDLKNDSDDTVNFVPYSNITNGIDSSNLKETTNNLSDIYVPSNSFDSDYSNMDNDYDDNSDKKSFLKDKIDNMYLGYKTRLIVNISCIIIFLLLAFIFGVYSVSINQKSNVNYKQTSNIDYKVYLKKNDYYNQDYLDKNMQYIASLIDNIKVNFNYSFNANQDINYKYTYYIKSEVRVSDSEDSSKIIYSKSDRLTNPNTIAKTSSNGFNISEDINVDYNKYNELVKSFKSAYLINADSNLVLSLYLDIEDEKGNKINSANSNEAMKLTIPLTEQMINIKMDYKEINNSVNAKIYRHFGIKNKILFSLSVFFFVGTVFYTALLVIFLRKTSAKKSAYDVLLSKILREYDRVIVNSKKNIDVTGEVIDLDSFEELLDVRDNLEKPIIYKEIHKGQKSIFVIKNGNETYRYILKLADLEKGNIK